MGPFSAEIVGRLVLRRGGGAVSTGDSVVEDTSLASLETSHSQSDFSYTQFVCPKELLSAPIGTLYIRMFN